MLVVETFYLEFVDKNGTRLIRHVPDFLKRIEINIDNLFIYIILLYVLQNVIHSIKYSVCELALLFIL